MQWFRSYVGTHSDPKFATVARKTGLHRTMVLAVWLAIEEFASASSVRGCVAGLDHDDVAAALDMETEQVTAAIVAFKAKGMITDDDRLAAWERRQFNSDVTDPTNAERQRRHREKRKNNGGVTEVTDDSSVSVSASVSESGGLEKKEERARDFASEFDEFYDTFPLHKDRAKAFSAYRKARRKTDAATLLAGAERYRDDPNRNPSFTKYPASWLNAESWLDEPGRGPPAKSRTMQALDELERRFG